MGQARANHNGVVGWRIIDMAKHNRNRRRMGWAAPLLRELADKISERCGDDAPVIVGRARRIADRLESKGRPVPRVQRIEAGMSSYGG